MVKTYKIKKAIQILLFLLLSFSCFGQTGNLRGVVIESYDKAPVHSVDIFLISNTDTIKQVCDLSGRFCFYELEFGKYKLKLRFISRTQDFWDLDTTIYFSENTNNLILEVRPLSIPTLKTDIELSYMHIPSNTDRYWYTITREYVKLEQHRTILKSSPYFEVERVDSSTFTHTFDVKEREILDSIIKSNHLDSVALYEKRIRHSLMFWNIKIMKKDITYEIDLNHYHNQGLDDLLDFVSGLIPEDKKYYWTR